MPSQYGEDQYVLEYFGDRVGHFVDIGAYDGLTYSNTRCLMERGWSGVCIEPNPLVFPYLMQNTAEFDEVALVCAAFGEEAGSLSKFWANQDCYSTTDKRHKALIESRDPAQKFREIHVPVINLGEDFTSDDPLFVNIDTEGTNFASLTALFKNAKPDMICVEADPPHEVADIKQLLAKKGYDMREVGGNILGWLPR